MVEPFLQRAESAKKLGGSFPVPRGHWFMSILRKSMSIDTTPTNLKNGGKHNHAGWRDSELGAGHTITTSLTAFIIIYYNKIVYIIGYILCIRPIINYRIIIM